MLLLIEIWAQGLIACSAVTVAAGSLKILTCKRNIYFTLHRFYIKRRRYLFALVPYAGTYIHIFLFRSHSIHCVRGKYRIL